MLLAADSILKQLSEDLQVALHFTFSVLLSTNVSKAQDRQCTYTSLIHTVQNLSNSQTSSSCHTSKEQHKLHRIATQIDSAIVWSLLLWLRRLSSFEWALPQ